MVNEERRREWKKVAERGWRAKTGEEEYRRSDTMKEKPWSKQSILWHIWSMFVSYQDHIRSMSMVNDKVYNSVLYCYVP